MEAYNEVNPGVLEQRVAYVRLKAARVFCIPG